LNLCAGLDATSPFPSLFRFFMSSESRVFGYLILSHRLQESGG
jgi:hypothetical protein